MLHKKTLEVLKAGLPVLLRGSRKGIFWHSTTKLQNRNTSSLVATLLHEER